MFVVIGIQEIYNKKKIPPITREEYNRGIAEAILETEPINATSLSTVASSSLICKYIYFSGAYAVALSICLCPSVCKAVVSAQEI